MKEVQRALKPKDDPKLKPTKFKYIYQYTDNNRQVFGYHTMKCKAYPDRKFVGGSRTMEQKLQDALDYLAGKDVPIYLVSYDHGDEWRATLAASKAYSATLPKYISPSTCISRNEIGFNVTCHPFLPNKTFGGKKLSVEEKLQNAIDYIASASTFSKEEQVEMREVKLAMIAAKKAAAKAKPKTTSRANGLPDYIKGLKTPPGYKVYNHPVKNDKSFQKTMLTMEQKLQLAIDYINSP